MMHSQPINPDSQVQRIDAVKTKQEADQSSILVTLFTSAVSIVLNVGLIVSIVKVLPSEYLSFGIIGLLLLDLLVLGVLYIAQERKHHHQFQDMYNAGRQAATIADNRLEYEHIVRTGLRKEQKAEAVAAARTLLERLNLDSSREVGSVDASWLSSVEELTHFSHRRDIPRSDILSIGDFVENNNQQHWTFHDRYLPEELHVSWNSLREKSAALAMRLSVSLVPSPRSADMYCLNSPEGDPLYDDKRRRTADLISGDASLVLDAYAELASHLRRIVPK